MTGQEAAKKSKSLDATIAQCQQPLARCFQKLERTGGKSSPAFSFCRRLHSFRVH